MPFHVICKICGERIAVANKPSGGTSLTNVQTTGPINISGGSISFGPGGGISFGPGGGIAFGPSPTSHFICPECAHSAEYAADEIQED
jgi:hypothetical protein